MYRPSAEPRDGCQWWPSSSSAQFRRWRKTAAERRCTGQWRATVEERIASCTALIDSGRYQPANLAILHDIRGTAARATGDVPRRGRILTTQLRPIRVTRARFANRASARAGATRFRSCHRGLRSGPSELDPTDVRRIHHARQRVRRERAIRARHRRLQRSHPAGANNATAYFNRGIAYPPQGDLDRAIADYDQAIRLDPNNASAYNNRGIAGFQKGDYDHAIADYNQAIRLDPSLAAAYNNRGDAWRARPTSSRAPPISIAPSSCRRSSRWPMTTARWSPTQKQDYDRAIADFDNAIRLDPANAQAFTNRGNAYAKTRVTARRHRGLRRGAAPRSEQRRAAITIAAWPCGAAATSTAPSPT